MSENDEQHSERHDRQIDLESLKALAHPLRVKIFDVLSTYGSFTASGLAERLGESSGATSYHLRQLAKHGFVREVDGKGVGRERWWERTPGGIVLGSPDTKETQAGREASQLVMREWSSSRERNLGEFLDRGFDELAEKWVEASVISLSNVWVTAEELAEFSERYMTMVGEFGDKHRDQRTPGSRPVQLQFHAFPVMDGEEIPTSEQHNEGTES
ncbi:MAG: helix-turn-helix transcriptional regulator [Cryobacterium sp.]|nr:helix-turn-helix transcriptional regulator [Cryobacterium sp.]